MTGKKIRPRNSQNSVPVANLVNRPLATPSKNAGGGSNSSKIPSEHLLTLTKEQLKVECRKRGQKTTGNRKELVGWLVASFRACLLLFSFVLICYARLAGSPALAPTE